jgi:hypothetical protein
LLNFHTSQPVWEEIDNQRVDHFVLSRWLVNYAINFDLSRNSMTISEESGFLKVSTCFTLNSGVFIYTALNLHFKRIIQATYNHNYISIPSSWECFIFYFHHCSLYKSLECQALFIHIKMSWCMGTEYKSFNME